jgi:hypothetical protein
MPNKQLHRINFTVTFFALRGKKAASKIYRLAGRYAERKIDASKI